MNPLNKAINSAVRSNDMIGSLFARIGTSDHPRGFVLSAYRQARRAMKTALAEEFPMLGVVDVLGSLRRTLSLEISGLLLEAQASGVDEAARQLAFYGIETTGQAPLAGYATQRAALDAVLARIDAQEALIKATLITNGSAELIIGDDERQGSFRPTDVVAALAFWAGSLVWNSFSEYVTTNSGGQAFKKQAIAALDNRTTNCCLRVHGQIQPLDGKFELTGTPRYANQMDWAPFHGWCRTSIALYLDGFDNGLTTRMQAGARKILDERDRGIFIDRHPADAFG